MLQASEWRTSRRYTREQGAKAFARFGPPNDRDGLSDARAPLTNIQYGSRWSCYVRWCQEGERQPMPASAGQVLDFFRYLRDERRLTAESIAHYLCALSTIHKIHHHPRLDRSKTVEPMNALRERAEPPRRMAPLRGDMLADLVRRFDPNNPRDARDAVILLLAYACAFRSCELVGLDWERPGSSLLGGTGHIARDPRGGYMITLRKSKTSRRRSKQLPLPDEDMPSLGPWLDCWLMHAGTKPGQPLFRSMVRGGRILPQRLAAESVISIVRRRVHAYAQATGKSEEEATYMCRLFGSHSMRRGYCTTAADECVPLAELRRRSRHTNIKQLGDYIEEAEGWHRSGLTNGVGF